MTDGSLSQCRFHGNQDSLDCVRFRWQLDDFGADFWTWIEAHQNLTKDEMQEVLNSDITVHESNRVAGTRLAHTAFDGLNSPHVKPVRGGRAHFAGEGVGVILTYVEGTFKRGSMKPDDEPHDRR